MELKDFLTNHDACASGMKYVESLKWDINSFWAECHRGDWMLWLAQKVGIERRLLVLTSGHCANTVRHLMKEERSVNAVDVCIRYGNGEATDAELDAAVAASVAAAADVAASVAAEAYAYAAAYAAASAAAYTAVAAEADEAYAAASVAAKAENRQQTADIVRKHIPVEMIIDKL